MARTLWMWLIKILMDAAPCTIPLRRNSKLFATNWKEHKRTKASETHIS